MKLNQDVNYIISGLERSGTSMLVQILKAGDIPTSFDDLRPADENNPKGYFELEKGKIINKLMDGSFPIQDYKGRFIKITAYGLKYLPQGKYKIIYSERNMEEILDSMEKMIGKKDSDRKETKKVFIKLNNMIKNYIQDRADIEVLFINYNDLIADPKNNIIKILDFLGSSYDRLDEMTNVIDYKLYRQRRKKMINSKYPKIIILGIDGLEYNLVEEWLLNNIKQKSHCKLDLSDYRVIVTPPIWGSMLTGKIDQEIIDIWVKQTRITGGGVKIEQSWWAKIGNVLPPKLGFWLWDHFFVHLIGEDAFEKTANYVNDKKEPTFFDFFKKPWTNGIPGYGKNVCKSIQKDLTEKAIAGEKQPYREFILEQYKSDKAQLISALNKNEYDIIFWYTSMLDNLGHMDMGKPLTMMMRHYLEINELVGIVIDRCPESIIYIISDHGMEQMNPKPSAWGMHSDHAYFSSSNGETIKKPYELYELISKHK